MKIQKHGLRHGQKIDGLIADTKSDESWVYLKTQDGKEVARQSKQSSGRFFRQGTNPDYKGYDGYVLQYMHDGEWRDYDRQAHTRAIVHQLHRLIER